MLKVVKEWGGCLKYASERLKDDKEIVLQAVKQRGRSLYWASERLKDDKEFLLEAVKQDGDTLQDASERLKDDKEIVLEAVKRGTWSGRTLSYASERLKDDKDIVLEAVKGSGYSLRYASERFNDDRKFVLEAVKQSGCSLSCASERLKDDKDIVLEAVKQNGGSLRFPSERLKDDKEIVFEAVKKNGWGLEFASERLKDDKEVVLEAVKQDAFHANKNVLKYTKNENFIRKICELDIYNLEYTSEKIKKDKEFVGKLLLEISKINRVDETVEIVDHARIFQYNPSREYREKKLVDFDHKIHNLEFYDKGIESEFQLIGDLGDQNICRFFETVVYSGNDRKKDEILDRYLKNFECESKLCESKKCLKRCKHWKLRWSEIKDKMVRNYGEDISGARKLVKELMKEVITFLPIRKDIWNRARNESEEKMKGKKFKNEKQRARRKWFLISQCFDRYILEYKIKTKRNYIYLGEFKEIGVAYCRHLSILFKIVCDIVGIRCRLVRGWMGITEKCHHQCYIVMVGHRLFMIDCMNQKMIENFEAKDYFNVGGKLRRTLQKEELQISKIEKQLL